MTVWLNRKAKCGWGFDRLVRTYNIFISFNFCPNFTEELRRKLIVVQLLLREKIDGCEGIKLKAGLRLRMELVRIPNQNVPYSFLFYSEKNQRTAKSNYSLLSI